MRPAPRPPTPDPEASFFGFRRVKPEEKTGLVREVFDSVAGRYDLMNDLMSGGLHRLWKDRLVRMMDPKPGQTILDLAGGTGDIALRCHKTVTGLAQSRLRGATPDLIRGYAPQSSRAQIIVCDINQEMLKAGKAKAINHGVLPSAVAVAGSRPGLDPGSRTAEQSRKNSIEWITGNAEELPLPARSVDLACIAFGLRNVTHIDKALGEVARVLKPGGKFYCLEFSPGVSPRLKPLVDRYCMEILPRMGRFVAKDEGAYRYLAESIRQFPDQPSLAARMEKAGFAEVKWLNLTGGIAVIHSGWRL